MYVSISAYDDGDLLANAIASVRGVLPDATVAVVDGRYETWPAEHDNSTDNTADVARDRADFYHADGPFARESDKHLARVDHAPDGEWALFLDADERLLTCPDPADLPERAIFPRIYNALTYGPAAVYWPRLFKPEWVETVKRWDKYVFDVPGAPPDDQAARDDRVTILHRHDLRDREYRAAKLKRFHNEGRTSRYEQPDADGDGQLEQYLAGEWPDVSFDECPVCGERSVTRSQETAYGHDEMTLVEACVRADGCYSTVVSRTVDEWRYLPDEWERGFAEDPRRLRAELVDAGCGFVTPRPIDALEQLRPAIGLWVDTHLGDDGREVLA